MPEPDDVKKRGKYPKADEVTKAVIPKAAEATPEFDKPKTVAKPKPIKRPFEALIEKYKIAKPEAAALKRFLPIEGGMIDEPAFVKGYHEWLNSPVDGSGR